MKLLRKLLLPVVPIYYLVSSLRNSLYDAGVKKSTHYNFPVICVGNLSVGGTGKTPMIEYLIRLLKSDYRLATLSRGYKRKTDGFIIANTDSDASSIGEFNGTRVGVASVLSAVDVTMVPHPQPAEGATYTINYNGKTVNGNVPILEVDYSLLAGQDGSASCIMGIPATTPANSAGVTPCIAMATTTPGSVPKRITYPAAVIVPGTLLPEIPPFGARLRDCIHGEYLEEETFECTKCSPGTFSNATNSKACTLCEVGKAPGK